MPLANTESASSPPPTGDDLKERVVRGGLAKLAAQVATFTLRIASMIVMARLLDPRDFGLVAMVGSVMGVFSLLRDAGLSRATVQRESVTQDQLSTLFWINILVGLVLAACFVALAPVLVSFYQEPRLAWVTASLAGGFVLNALGVQHAALLQRQMRFITETLIDLASLVASLAAGIAVAAAGFGYWALVASALVSPAVGSAGAWLAVRWVPHGPRRGAGVLSMIRFGGTVTLNSLLVYVAYNVDKVLLGRFAGAEALGIYGRAYQLVNIPIQNLNGAVGGVAFSALSRLQTDPARLRRYFLKGYSLVLAITVPLTIGCAVFARDVVLVALGAKWAAAVPLLQLLSPTILVFALINPLSWLMLACGFAVRSLRMSMVIAPLVIIGYAFGLSRGAAGVALAFSAVMVLLAVPLTAWAVRDTPVSMRDIVLAAGRPLISGLAVTALALLAAPLLARVGHPLLRLATGSGMLFLSYAWILLQVMGQKSFYVELLRSLSGRPSAGPAT